MHKSATKCNETISKWCKNKHGASKIIDTFETYHYAAKPINISHRCSWIMVYVLYCNAQVNLIVIFMKCTCIVMHSLFCQLPSCNLFTWHVIYLYGETPLVKCGPQSIFLHIYYHLLQAPFTFRKYYSFTYYKQISFST
jgi:hypothetical protein